jgi:hypothetical protein
MAFSRAQRHAQRSRTNFSLMAGPEPAGAVGRLIDVTQRLMERRADRRAAPPALRHQPGETAMRGTILRARKCVTLSAAVLLAIGLMSVPASAQASTSDDSLSSGELAVLLLLGKGAAGVRAKSRTYARMPQPYAGGLAGSSLPAAQQRFYPGMIHRFSAGDRSGLARHGINDVTMKRGIVGTGAMPVRAFSGSPPFRRPR